MSTDKTDAKSYTIDDWPVDTRTIDGERYIKENDFLSAMDASYGVEFPSMKDYIKWVDENLEHLTMTQRDW